MWHYFFLRPGPGKATRRDHRRQLISMESVMHVVQISFFVDPERRDPETLMEEWFTMTDIAGAVASTGARTTVIQASMVPGHVDRGGVSYRFVAPDAAHSMLTRSKDFAELLRAARADVFHVHGLGFAREIAGLRELAPRVPILLQDHAEKVPRLWKRTAWRQGVACASGLSFCALEQAEPFRRARLIDPQVEIFEIPESTSSFTPGDVSAARALTGVTGDPAVLWVGHLNRNKDPLTVLQGVSAAARHLPNLELWCCFGSAPLKSLVEKRISADPRLAERVHLLGSVPHEKVEHLMRAADLLVLGSRREGSSYAVIEALATGLEPIVTDIPSLRALTSGGAVGELWTRGDPESLTAALLRAARKDRQAVRRSVRGHFEANLSSVALGRRLAAAYRNLAGRHGSTAAQSSVIADESAWPA